MDLSIIIPVFKVEDTLAECLRPLLDVRSIDFEILLIDDGSPDNSLSLAYSFATQLPQLQILTQEHKGVAAARNLGLGNARGKYIFFYDPDDFLVSCQLKGLVQETLRLELDLGIGKGMIYSEAGTLKPLSTTISKSGVHSGPDLYDFSRRLNLHLFKRSFLQENRLFFTEEINHEDQEFLAICYARALKAASFPFDFYRFRYREVSHIKNPRHKELNKKSVSSYALMARHLLYLPAPSPAGKAVLYSAVNRFILEILRRLEYQKQVGIIKEIPSWKELDLEGILNDLPLKYRWPIYWQRLKLYFS